MDFLSHIEKYLTRTGFEKFQPKAALLDMDGTLYDSMPHHADAWMGMCAEAGLQATRDEFFMLEGSTGAAVINILYNRCLGRDATQQEIDRLYAIKSANFNAMPKVGPMPGAPQLLQWLNSQDIRCILVTGSGQKSLITRLQRDFPGIFDPDKLVTAHNTEHSKPHPDPYLKGMQLAAVQPWQAIAFENAPLGVESASRSHAFTVAVATGPIPQQALAEAGADIVFNSMIECANTLPRLLYTLSSDANANR